MYILCFEKDIYIPLAGHADEKMLRITTYHDHNFVQCHRHWLVFMMPVGFLPIVSRLRMVPHHSAYLTPGLSRTTHFKICLPFPSPATCLPWWPVVLYAINIYRTLCPCTCTTLYVSNFHPYRIRNEMKRNEIN